MGEEKQEKKQEKPEKEAPKAAEVKQAPKPEKAPKKTSAKKNNHPKVTKMTLGQVEAQIAVAKEKMGGLHSRHGLALLARRRELTQGSQDSLKKAA